MAATSRGRRNPALVAASVAAHAVLLGLLAWRTVEPPAPREIAPPTFLIQIEPRPLLRDEAAPRPRSVPAEAASPTARPAAAQASATVPHRPRDEDEEEDRPSTPVPRRPAAAPAGTPAPAAEEDRWRLRPEPTGQAIARSLRASPVGCARPERLSPAEREVCAERLGERADRAAPIVGSGDAARDARFAREGAAAIAAYEARRRPLSGGFGVSGASPDCPGGNLRGTCAGAHLPEHYQLDESNPRDRSRR